MDAQKWYRKIYTAVFCCIIFTPNFSNTVYVSSILLCDTQKIEEVTQFYNKESMDSLNYAKFYQTSKFDYAAMSLACYEQPFETEVAYSVWATSFAWIKYELKKLFDTTQPIMVKYIKIGKE